MNEMESSFNTEFSHWNIHLPKEDVAQRAAGKIVQAGWAIWYRFGSDEEGEFLDFYASHRMTDDRHTRIRADGSRISLPTIGTFRMVSDDPVEDARLEEQSRAENQRIAEMLQAKGFVLTGDEPGGVQMNMLLRLYGLPNDEQKDRRDA